MVSVDNLPSAEIAVNPALTRFQVFDDSKLFGLPLTAFSSELVAWLDDAQRYHPRVETNINRLTSFYPGLADDCFQKLESLGCQQHADSG